MQLHRIQFITALLALLFAVPVSQAKGPPEGKGKGMAAETSDAEAIAEKKAEEAKEAAEMKAEEAERQAEKMEKARKKKMEKAKGLEKQREKKAEQVQKELDKGSEKGKAMREEHRRKWWKFWGNEAETPEETPAE